MRSSISDAPQCLHPVVAISAPFATRIIFGGDPGSAMIALMSEADEVGFRSRKSEGTAQPPAHDRRGRERERDARPVKPERREFLTHPVKLRLREPQQWHRPKSKC